MKLTFDYIVVLENADIISKRCDIPHMMLGDTLSLTINEDLEVTRLIKACDKFEIDGKIFVPKIPKKVGFWKYFFMGLFGR